MESLVFPQPALSQVHASHLRSPNSLSSLKRWKHSMMHRCTADGFTTIWRALKTRRTSAVCRPRWAGSRIRACGSDWREASRTGSGLCPTALSTVKEKPSTDAGKPDSWTIPEEKKTASPSMTLGSFGTFLVQVNIRSFAMMVRTQYFYLTVHSKPYLALNVRWPRELNAMQMKKKIHANRKKHLQIKKTSIWQHRCCK